MKIFDAHNYHLEATITTPFQNSLSSTYFRRPSWSPDGAHISAPNAVNSSVSTVAIIQRGIWDSDKEPNISLVGHEAPVEVTAFNPRLFQISSTDPHSGHLTIVAAAGQDRTVSVWNTLSARPVLVLNDISDKSVSDLCWTPDGLSLLASTYDGNVIVLQFPESEFGRVMPLEANVLALERFGSLRKALEIPESVEQLKIEEQARKETKEFSSKMVNGNTSPARPASNTVTNGTSSPSRSNIYLVLSGEDATASAPAVKSKIPANTTSTDPNSANQVSATPNPTKQVVTITKDGKKRVAPQLVKL